MRRLGRWGIRVGLMLLLCQAGAPGLAAERQPPKTEEEGSGGKMFRKAVRGGQNLAFGLVTDVPRTIYYEARDNGALYGFTVGVVKGVGLGVIRSAVGAWELLTFPIPANDYDPVVLPAFPFEAGPTEVFPERP